eukprot:363247-Chlamydomonas_euryale.AAC.6
MPRSGTRTWGRVLRSNTSGLRCRGHSDYAINRLGAGAGLVGCVAGGETKSLGMLSIGKHSAGAQVQLGAFTGSLPQGVSGFYLARLHGPWAGSRGENKSVDLFHARPRVHTRAQQDPVAVVLLETLVPVGLLQEHVFVLSCQGRGMRSTTCVFIVRDTSRCPGAGCQDSRIHTSHQQERPRREALHE